MLKKRTVRRMEMAFNLLTAVLIAMSVGFGYNAWSFFIETQQSEIIEEPVSVAKSCNKKVYKARWDCRKLLVDNHYEVWKEKKDLIKQYCDEIATHMYCEDI